MEYFGVLQVNFVNLRSFHFGVTMEFSLILEKSVFVMSPESALEVAVKAF